MEAALIVGGAGSIGIEVVRRLPRGKPHDYMVHVVDRNYGRLADLSQEELRQVRFHPGDASNPDHVACVYSTLASQGITITQIVFTVGGMVPIEPDQPIEEHVEANMRANFWSVVNPIDQMIRLFRAGTLLFTNPPTIIVLSTVDAVVVLGDQLNCGYAVAKAALERYLRAVAAGFRGPNDPILIVLRLGTVIPFLDALANERWQARLLVNPLLRRILGQRLNRGEVLTPERVASKVVWLLECPEPAMFNGAIFDGSNGFMPFGHCRTSDEPNPYGNPKSDSQS